MYKIYLISAEGYINAGVHFLKIEKTDEIWPSIKDVGDGIGVKNISDSVLKEICGIYGEKELTKEEIKSLKLQKEKFIKSLIT